MYDFIYNNRTELVFGNVDSKEIARKIKEYNPKKVLIVYGQNSVVKSGLLEKVTSGLKGANIEFVEFGGTKANPLRSYTQKGVDLAKKEKCDFILAVGGGSVIDAAKGIAAGVANGDMWKFYSTDAELTKALPIAVILTLPAAGSEGSGATVLVDDESGTKYSFGSDIVRPKLSFVDPRNCMSLPREQISYGASDIIAHMMERYFCPQENVTVTDELLGGAIKAMIKIAPKLYNEPTNYDYWAEFCLLGTLAHNDMLNMGRDDQDWGTHLIENKLLSGPYNIAHGAGLAIIFPAWMKYVATKRPSKLVQFAREVLDVTGADDRSVVTQGIQKMEEWYQSIGLKLYLSQINIKIEDVKDLAKKLFDPNIKLGGYGQLSFEEIIKVVELAK